MSRSPFHDSRLAAKPADQELQRLLESVVILIRSAGDVVMQVYASDFVVREKTDNSPVTEADQRAEALILSGLSALRPRFPVVAEETAADLHLPATVPSWWLVDPLDGTKEFISRNGEFTVNIALISDGRPVLGAVYAPALDRLYGGAIGTGAFLEHGAVRKSIKVRQAPTDGMTVVASRSHGDAQALDAFLAGRKIRETLSIGSSLKLCLVAEGRADLYPRLGPTMEWDIAAGHAVLAAAGGQVRTLEGEPFRYGKPGYRNPHFVASGAPPD